MGHVHGPDGAHSHGNGGSGLGGLLLVILGLALVASIAGPVAAAVAELVRVVLIALAVIAGVGVLGLAGFVVYRLRERAADRAMWDDPPPAVLQAHAEPLPASPQPSLPALPAAAVPATGRPAKLHLHFHGLTADEAAAIIRQARPVHGSSDEHPPAIEED
jgi:hypothetical protein